MKTVLSMVLAVSLAYVGAALAHGGGVALDRVAGDYIASVEFDALDGMRVGESVQFTFHLYNKDRTQTMDFSDVWVTLIPAGDDTLHTPPIFDGGIAGPKTTSFASGMTFVFPKGGSYDMKLRYDGAEKTLAEVTFPLSVLDVQDTTTAPDYMNSALFFASGVLGTLILLFVIRTFRKRSA